jgi:hypothetical protein
VSAVATTTTGNGFCARQGLGASRGVGSATAALVIVSSSAIIVRPVRMHFSVTHHEV